MRRLPKSLLFGILGASGGLLGATVFGEAVWWILRPPAPVAISVPPLRLAASPAVELYQGGTNRLGVKIARDGWAEPVTVNALDVPVGVHIDRTVIPANCTEFEVEVRAAADAAAGSHEITLTAEGPARARSPRAEATTLLTIRKTLPPQPAPADQCLARGGRGAVGQESLRSRDRSGPVLGAGYSRGSRDLQPE